MEHYSNFCTFELASLVNVLGHYLRKYGTYLPYLAVESGRASRIDCNIIHASG